MAIAVVVSFAGAAAAQTSGDLVTAVSPPAPQRHLDFTLVDAPYNTSNSGRAPSMRQSLEFSIATYEGLHGGIERLFGPRRGLGKTAIVLADLATTLELALPLTSIWVHEEFHRAAMGRRGVDSHNDVLDLKFGGAWIAVSHVRDADLARLKREHPADWVRVNEAGIEGELLLVRDLERRRFFGRSTAWHLPLYWLTKLGTIGYVRSGSWDDTDADVDVMNIEDGTNIERRDFTGHDLLGWVYDLHRPDEPYDTRGVHPSGVGIDRYRRRAHLTSGEQSYLKRQGQLQLLNLVDPFLFGINGGLPIGRGADPVRVSGGLSHYLTSFGHTLDVNVLARKGAANMAVTLHAYKNRDSRFAGLETELLDYPIEFGGRGWTVSPRLAVWMQPALQRFDSARGTAGGLAGLRLRTAMSRHMGAFVDLEAKSAGWVAGSEYLGRNVSFRVGLSLR